MEMANQPNQQNFPESIQLMSELISTGLIEVNNCNKRGSLPLHIAVKNEKYLLTELLLQNGARIDDKGKRGDTALALAVYALLPEMVKILLDHKATLTGIRKDGSSGLWLAVSKKTFTPQEKSKKMLVIDSIIQHGLKSKHQCEANYYKLCKAVINEDFRAGKRLVHSLPNIRFDDIQAENPLKFAVYLDQLKMAELLLTKGVSHKSRRSALVLAIRKENSKMAELLLRFQIDVNFRVVNTQQRKDTPLYFATELKNLELMKLLVHYGANVNDLNYEADSYQSVLHLACTNGFSEGIKFLLESQADVNKRNDLGETPLHIACMFSNLENIKLLVKHAAQVTAVSKKGSTILHFASRNYHLGVVKYVIDLAIENGIEVNTRDTSGLTAIHRDCSCSNFVEFLKSGADLNIRSNSNRLPIHDCFFLYDDDGNEGDSYCPSFDYLQRMCQLGYVVNNPRIPRNVLTKKHYLELDRLKQETIASNPRITMYDVMLMSRQSLVRYSKNMNLKEAFANCDNDFERKYPYFGSFLNVQWRRGVHRKSLMVPANDNLQKILSKSVPEVCSDMIFKYLTNDCLKKYADEKFK